MTSQSSGSRSSTPSSSSFSSAPLMKFMTSATAFGPPDTVPSAMMELASDPMCFSISISISGCTFSMPAMR